jgi:hypothetical protein
MAHSFWNQRSKGFEAAQMSGKTSVRLHKKHITISLFDLSQKALKPIGSFTLVDVAAFLLKNLIIKKKDFLTFKNGIFPLFSIYHCLQ